MAPLRLSKGSASVGLDHVVGIAVANGDTGVREGFGLMQHMPGKG